MKPIGMLALAGLAFAQISYAQTVSTFAGQQNDTDPYNNFDNVTVDDPLDAYFWEPAGITIDPNGNIYIVERNKVRLYNGSKLYNRAGKLGDPNFSQGYDDGTGNDAEFYAPTSIVCNSDGEGFIVDSENHAIRKISKFTTPGNGQIVTTFAGTETTGSTGGRGTPGSSDGTGLNASFNTPKGICLAADGNYYVTDYNNYTIRRITPSAAVSTLSGKAGIEGTADNTNGGNARWGGPYGIASYDQNHVIVTDNWNSCIRKVNLTSGATTTICGKAGDAYIQDGTLAQARFKEPRGITVVDGLIYVADGSTIRVIDEANNSVSTFAGSSSAVGTTDGVGANARFGRLGDIHYDGNFTLYVTDIYYNIIRSVTLDNLRPQADFSASKTSLEINETVTITDESTGATVTSRTWDIRDLNNSTANVSLVNGSLTGTPTIDVKFTASGFYSVSLDITNDFGTDMISKNSYINVSVTGSVDIISAEDLIKVYPNPATDVVKVKSPLLTGAKSEIQMLDQTGRIVRSIANSGSETVSFNVNGLTSGIYMIQVSTPIGTSTKRIVVE